MSKRSIKNSTTKNIVAVIKQQARRGHAFLIETPQNIDVGRIAEAVQKDQQPSPDARFLLEPQEDSRLIRIAQLRALKRWLYLKEFVPRIKMISIYYPERFSLAAANAMLKMLEEPPSEARFYLFSVDVEAVLPTIRSRCQQISGLEALVEEEQEVSKYKSADIFGPGVVQKLRLAQKLSQRSRPAQERMLDIWMKEVYNSERLKKSDKYKYLTSLKEAKRALKYTNLNSRTIFEHLFIKIEP